MSLLFPVLRQPAPWRKRLWQGGIALLVLIATFAIGNSLISRERAVTSDMLGRDFLAFYISGRFVRDGQVQLLYNLEAVKEFEQHLARKKQVAGSNGSGPFWNPPFYAWLFAPLSSLPYRTARDFWMLANVVALAGALILLCRMFPANIGWRSWALVPLLVLVSMPVIQAFSHGQNTFMSLFVLCAVVTAWRKQWDVIAGIVCGLLFYKPQLAAVVAGMLVITRGWRPCIGLSFTLGMLFLLTAATMPNAIGDYLVQLPANIRFFQIDNEYLWERHVTLKSLWRLLIQGRGAGEPAMIVSVLTGLTCAGFAIGLLWAALRRHPHISDEVWTGETRFIHRDRLIAATIAAMPLLMPFYFDYDLLLLSVPAVLFAGELAVRAPGQPIDRGDRLLINAFVALFIWMMVNPIVAGLSHINLNVIFLATVAALLIRRATFRVTPEEFNIEQPQVIRVTSRRAA